MKGQCLVSSPRITRFSQLTLATLATYEWADGPTAAGIVTLYLTLHNRIFGGMG